MELREAVDRLRYELYRAEGFSDDDLRSLPPPPGTRDYARYLDYLDGLAEKRTPEIARGFRCALDRSLQLFARAVPKHEPSPLTAQVVDFIPEIGRLVEDMAEPFFRADPRLFRKLRERITENTNRAGKLRPSKLVGYAEPRQLVETYFAGTPLLDLFLAEIPMPFPVENRFAGHWILARPNAGKTQALSYLIEQDLPLVAEGKASIIIMDSQGNTPGENGKPPTLLHTVSHLKLFAPGQPLHGRLIYIDPADEPTIPFNLFDLGFPGSPEARFAGTKKLLEFVFTALLGEPFSPPMEMLFAHALRLMLAIPGAKLADLRRLLIKGGMERYAREITKLDEETQQFFTEQFGKSNLEVTKNAVLKPPLGP